MGQRYQNHHHQRCRTTLLLPLLCGTSKSNKNPKLPKCPSNKEPSSPKVGCMGQIKRSNKVNGVSSSSSTTAASTLKYTKLQKLFSSKNLTKTPKPPPVNRYQWKPVADVEKLDPPLPVIKKSAACEEVCIWKRRCNGSGGLKLMEIQQIQVPNSVNQLPSLVTV